MDMGQRIAARIDAVTPSVTRKEFAERIGMTPDALSRALGGKRGFASIELVKIADELNADIHELITGAVNPHQVLVTARHDYNHETANRSVPTFTDDKAVLEEICVAYEQAGLPSREHRAVSTDAADVRETLGDGFVRPFADRIEERLHIDVVRVGGLGTAYSADVSGRTFIAIPTSGSWFRENWDLAHELAHVAGLKSELEANAFAANLLLPEDLMRSVDWSSASQEAIADFLWLTGVSTMALKIRLQKLRLPFEDTTRVLDQKTQGALRRSRSWSPQFGDEVTERMSSASQHRFPLALQEAHEVGVEEGRIGPGYLAWMRNIAVAEIAEAYSPQLEDPAMDDLAAAFGLAVV